MAKRNIPRLRFEIDGRLKRACLHASVDEIEASCRTSIEQRLEEKVGKKPTHKKEPKNGGQTATVVFKIRDTRSVNGECIDLGTYLVSTKDPGSLDRVIAAIPSILAEARQLNGVAA